MSCLHALIVAGHCILADLNITTYHDPNIATFSAQPRSGAVKQIIVHESVTTTPESTARALQKNGYGVHISILPDGSLHQHHDLVLDRLVHATGHNDHSIGVELITPYYSRVGPWKDHIADAPWAHKGRYVPPTLAQLEALATLIRLVLALDTPGLDVPPRWPGIYGGRAWLTKLPEARAGPGVWAHHYIEHADGAWPVLYAYLRLERQLTAPCAYQQALRLASHGRRLVPLPKPTAPRVSQTAENNTQLTCYRAE